MCGNINLIRIFSPSSSALILGSSTYKKNENIIFLSRFLFVLLKAHLMVTLLVHPRDPSEDQVKIVGQSWA